MTKFLKLFRTPDGKNHALTFALISTLFFLWGFCNGMIDVMDKHFQTKLNLSLSQSAWVQFSHYLGYFLMALPAGLVANKLGYKGGTIVGLLLVAVGGFWFLPATHISAFWAFLLGVCLIASGLTFLETVANPYTTVLGPKEGAATRINLAQSLNGVGWFLGPIAGSMYFYSATEADQGTGSETLWVPYTGVAIVVVVLAVIFYFASMPEIEKEDEYHMDDRAKDVLGAAVDPVPHRGGALWLVWVNIVVLSVAVGMILSAISTIFAGNESSVLPTFAISFGVLVVLGTAAFLWSKNRITHHNVWLHLHFSSGTLAQFFYVGAQSGVFAFFINYLTPSRSGSSQVPPIPDSWADAMNNLVANSGILHGWLSGWFAVGADGARHLTDKGGANLASVAFLCFLLGRLTGSAILKNAAAHKVLAFFAFANVITCLVIVLHLGWLSVAAVFACYFFMSIMFPTIFALSIFGLGDRAKKASSFIVMAIMGGAILPKSMGYVADVYGISTGFIMPLACFLIVALYGLAWPRLSRG